MAVSFVGRLVFNSWSPCSVQAFLWSRALNSGHANKESDDNDDDGNLSPIEIMRAIAIFLATQFVVTALLLVWPAWSDPTFLNGLPRRPGGSSLSSRGSVSAGVGRGFTACRIALPWALGGSVCFAAALGGQVCCKTASKCCSGSLGRGGSLPRIISCLHATC